MTIGSWHRFGSSEQAKEFVELLFQIGFKSSHGKYDILECKLSRTENGSESTTGTVNQF